MSEPTNRRALVCGARGFIGGHLVKKLKHLGYWVRGVNIKMHEFCSSEADEFLLLGLREKRNCEAALKTQKGKFGEAYQLAADMGGMGFIQDAECEIMHNNSLINIHMIRAAVTEGIRRYLFPPQYAYTGTCNRTSRRCRRRERSPANPDNEYGWEKLYSERILMAHRWTYGIEVRIARLQNCYGPEGTWCGGREKAPAAICRKVAEVKNSGAIEVWGDGTAIRSYTHVSDIVMAFT